MHRTERLTQDETDQKSAHRRRTWLVRVGLAGAPLTQPEIYDLDEADRFRIGRLHQPELNDPWLSADHAEIRNDRSGWELQDLGSSNGTFYWGERRSSAQLSDGDLIETGGTFWIFRSMALENAPPKGPYEGPLATLHPPFADELVRLRRVARTRVPMMILGSTGAGKEVLAKEIHKLSHRNGPFVAINTAAVQRTLIASELFGVEKGAHSMAERSRVGQIRAAEGGTLLLDEIGDMPIEVQASLLRVLQESEIIPVGGDNPVKVDVRVVCATHRDLQEMVDSGSFRADLYARLNGCRIVVPDLAERPEDVGLIIGSLMRRFGATDLTFTPAAYRALLAYSWPLNVRELEKALETAIALVDDRRIELKHLPSNIQEHRPEVLRQTAEGEELEEVYEREIVRLMTAHHGNVSAVARSMGRSRMQIHRWLKRLALNPDSFRR